VIFIISPFSLIMTCNLKPKNQPFVVLPMAAIKLLILKWGLQKLQKYDGELEGL